MNIMRGLIPIFIFAALANAYSKDDSPWPESKRCAVSLTYDDAVPVHHETIAPLLDAHGLRATFYLAISLVWDPEPWKAIAANGHELGNHSLFHPCRREPPENFEWLNEQYDLADYNEERLRDELRVANSFLKLLDGGKSRTYGNNCTHLTIGRGENEIPMDPILDELFVAARGTQTNQTVDPEHFEITRLGHFSGDGKTFEQLKGEIEEARKDGNWIIYMFHGVGEGTHPLFVDDIEHRKLVEWLDSERESIWTAPVVEVAEWLLD